jgi:sulfatase modifying factor 1
MRASIVSIATISLIFGGTGCERYQAQNVPDAAPDMALPDLPIDSGDPVDAPLEPDGRFQWPESGIPLDSGPLPDLQIPKTETFVTVNAGKFTMGSPATEKCRVYEETQHDVTLTHNFELGAYEVTQGQFEKLMKYNESLYSDLLRFTELKEPERTQREKEMNPPSARPVDSINWYEAVAYCNALSRQAKYEECYSCTGSGKDVVCSVASKYKGSGKIYDCPGYRLPTEAEWEYAYRAGSQVAHFTAKAPDGTALDGQMVRCSDVRDATVDWKLDTELDKTLWWVAWYNTNAETIPRPVGRAVPNAWGLYDMAGNAWEWCHDWREAYPTSAVTDPSGPETGSTKIVRGGGAESRAMYLRAAYRNQNRPDFRGFHIGFRVARTLP